MTALFPEIRVSDLSPAQFYREFKHGREDVVRSSFSTSVDDSGNPIQRVKGERKTKLTHDQVRYLRQNLTSLSLADRESLAKRFSISKAFLYKVGTLRTMKSVSDEGNIWDPAS